MDFFVTLRPCFALCLLTLQNRLIMDKSMKEDTTKIVSVGQIDIGVPSDHSHAGPRSVPGCYFPDYIGA